MSEFLNRAQGMGLLMLTKVSSSDWLDRLKLRGVLEKTLYNGSKLVFSSLSATQKQFKSGNKPKKRLNPQSKGLFDLSLSEEQQQTREMILSFANNVLRPAAHDADHHAKIDEKLTAQINELYLNMYALPEAYDGVAADRSTVSHVLIAEDLAYGDFSLAASALTSYSAINAIVQWGNEAVQNRYLPAFNQDPPAAASIAVQESKAGFNPFELDTTASKKDDHYLISGEKALVLNGEQADIYLVAATLDGKAQVFVVERDQSIEFKSAPAMGLKAAQTVNLKFNQSKAMLLSDEQFDYSSFIDLGDLMWCALAVGCAKAVKEYCINYANERVAFGEPISHRQSVAFMIADMAIEIDSMQMLLWNAASLAEAGKPFHREAYLAKLLCAEKSMKIGNDGVQILGGHGFTKEHPVERWYRDLRSVAVMQSGLHA